MDLLRDCVLEEAKHLNIRDFEILLRLSQEKILRILILQRLYNKRIENIRQNRKKNLIARCRHSKDQIQKKEREILSELRSKVRAINLLLDEVLTAPQEKQKIEPLFDHIEQIFAPRQNFAKTKESAYH